VQESPSCRADSLLAGVAHTSTSPSLLASGLPSMPRCLLSCHLALIRTKSGGGRAVMTKKAGGRGAGALNLALAWDMMVPGSGGGEWWLSAWGQGEAAAGLLRTARHGGDPRTAPVGAEDGQCLIGVPRVRRPMTNTLPIGLV